jgi:hypothetical protein
LPEEEVEERLLFTPGKQVTKDDIIVVWIVVTEYNVVPGSTVEKCEKCDRDKWVRV